MATHANITLTALVRENHIEPDLPVRKMTLTQTNQEAILGRASNKEPRPRTDGAKDKHTISRIAAPDNGYISKNETIASEHAALVLKRDGEVYLEHRAGRFPPTFLNGIEVKDCERVENNDTINLGPMKPYTSKHKGRTYQPLALKLNLTFDYKVLAGDDIPSSIDGEEEEYSNDKENSVSSTRTETQLGAIRTVFHGVTIEDGSSSSSDSSSAEDDRYDIPLSTHQSKPAHQSQTETEVIDLTQDEGESNKLEYCIDVDSESESADDADVIAYDSEEEMYANMGLYETDDDSIFGDDIDSTRSEAPTELPIEREVAENEFAPGFHLQYTPDEMFDTSEESEDEDETIPLASPHFTASDIPTLTEKTDAYISPSSQENAERRYDVSQNAKKCMESMFEEAKKKLQHQRMENSTSTFETKFNQGTYECYRPPPLPVAANLTGVQNELRSMAALMDGVGEKITKLAERKEQTAAELSEKDRLEMTACWPTTFMDLSHGKRMDYSIPQKPEFSAARDENKAKVTSYESFSAMMSTPPKSLLMPSPLYGTAPCFQLSQRLPPQTPALAPSAHMRLAPTLTQHGPRSGAQAPIPAQNQAQAQAAASAPTPAVSGWNREALTINDMIECTSVPGPEPPKPRSTKRKADEITSTSNVGLEEVRTALGTETRLKSPQPMITTVPTKASSQQIEELMRISERPMKRPTKRLKRVVEAMGYATLGGVALFAALVATAPEEF